MNRKNMAIMVISMLGLGLLVSGSAQARGGRGPHMDGPRGRHEDRMDDSYRREREMREERMERHMERDRRETREERRERRMERHMERDRREMREERRERDFGDTRSSRIRHLPKAHRHR